MAAPKRKGLTLAERIKVLERHERGESSKRIAETLGVGKTQIQGIVKNKESIKRRWEDGENADSKNGKKRKCLYADVNDELWVWFCQARGRNIPVSGRLLQEKALQISLDKGYDNFSASNGWLQSWQARHNVKVAVLCGESADVREDVLQDWAQRLPALCADYAIKDIFNADETGLFYRALPTKSLVAKNGSDTAGVKVNKNRLTVLMAVSAAGEKLKPVVIGKSKKPRCFQGANVAELGISYYNNRKAWMTRDIFCDWASKLNNKMRSQDRKILVFVDNCSSHPPLQLSHVKFSMLPPHTTSKLQPCDAGIIQTVKLNYRKRLLRHVLYEMDKDSTATGTQLAGAITLLDAIIWLKGSWDILQKDTIVKCFAKCGFATDHPVQESATLVEETDKRLQSLLPEHMTMEQFASLDDDLQTSTEITEAVEEVEEEEDDEEDRRQPEAGPIDTHTAVTYIRELQKYSLAHIPELVTLFNEAESSIHDFHFSRVCKQTSILDFFKK